MPITVNCPSCGGAMRVPDNLAGKKVKCPKCAQIMALPADLGDGAAIQATAPAPAVPPPLDEGAPPPRERPGRDRRDRRDDRDDRRDRDRDDRDREDDRYEDERDDDIERVRVRSRGDANNGMAIAGMVLGIVGFLTAFVPCVGWVLAIIMGIVGATLSGIGLGTANKLGSGKGMAVAGLVLSILAIIWVPIWFFILTASAAHAVNQAAVEFEKAVKNNPQMFAPAVQPGAVLQGQPTPVTSKLTLNNGQASVQANLADNDPRDRVRGGSACKVYTVSMAAGKTYTITMVRGNNKGLDPYLRLEDPAGAKYLLGDDDGAGNLNSRMVFPCNEAGEYRIVATALWGTGPFTLTVTEQ